MGQRLQYPMPCSQSSEAVSRNTCACARLANPAGERSGTGEHPQIPSPELLPHVSIANVPVVCWIKISALLARLSQADLQERLENYLFETDLHLEKIARLRAVGDFTAAATEARLLSDKAVDIGAMRVSAGALRLELACINKRRVASYRLLSELGQICSQTELTLSEWQIRLPDPDAMAFLDV